MVHGENLLNKLTLMLLQTSYRFSILCLSMFLAMFIVLGIFMLVGIHVSYGDHVWEMMPALLNSKYW